VIDDTGWDEIIAATQRARETDGTPGMVIALAEAKGAAEVRCLGEADVASGTSVAPHHVFQIGSIGKSFAAMLAVQLHEEGLIDLHAPVADVLPWFDVRTSYDPITLHHLLTHTAGIAGGSLGLVEAHAEVWALRDTETAWPPGSRYHYSNAGYKAVGLAIERACDAPYAEVLAERILQPIGMTSTWPATLADVRPLQATPYVPMFDDRPYRSGHPLAPAPWFEDDGADGSICSTGGDMARYAQVWLRGGATEDGHRLVSPEGFSAITTPWIRTGGKPYGYGIGIDETNDGVRWVHGGDTVGFAAHLLVEPELGLAVVAMANGPSTPGSVTRAAVEIIRAARGGGQSSRPTPESVEGHVGRAGTYDGYGSSIAIDWRHGRLELSFDGERVVLEAVDGVGGAYFAPHPRFERALLEFDPSADLPDGIWHGGRWYARRGSPALVTPDDLNPYVGWFRSNSPWLPAVRLVARRDRLCLIEPTEGVARALVPLGDHTFRHEGDPAPPERIGFERQMEGRMWIVRIEGLAYHRCHEPRSSWPL